jgi:uncharacterized protein YnzC (UPF0291/DUF896 family)
MPASASHRKVTLRLYEEQDKDIVAWFDNLTDEKSNQIKRLLRLGLDVQKDGVDGKKSTAKKDPSVTAAFDENALLDTLRKNFLPDVRAVVEASLQSVSFVDTRSNENGKTPNVVPVEMVSAHLLDDDDDEDEDD